MTPERKKYLSEKRKQHNRDKKEAIAIEHMGIYPYPMDIPSLYRAVYGDRRVPFLSTGADWLDKRHRVADSAMQEIRALRRYILDNLNKKP